METGRDGRFGSTPGRFEGIGFCVEKEVSSGGLSIHFICSEERGGNGGKVICARHRVRTYRKWCHFAVDSDADGIGKAVVLFFGHVDEAEAHLYLDGVLDLGLRSQITGHSDILNGRFRAGKILNQVRRVR